MLSVSRATRPVALFDDSTLPGASAYGPGIDRLEAVASRAGLAVERLGRDALNAPATDLNRYSALLFGGGYAYPGYTHFITPEAKGRIRDFVGDGGTYLGICAGAFLAAEQVAWHGGVYGRESGYSLGLFPGTAVGPILGLADYPSWRLTEMNVGTRTQPVWYAAGPWFAPRADALGSVDVLGTYASPELPEHGTPAAVDASFGDGRVLLWGPHPEGNPNSQVDTSVAADALGTRLCSTWSGA